MNKLTITITITDPEVLFDWGDYPEREIEEAFATLPGSWVACADTIEVEKE